MCRWRRRTRTTPSWSWKRRGGACGPARRPPTRTPNRPAAPPTPPRPPPAADQGPRTSGRAGGAKRRRGARNALRPLLGDDQVTEIERQVESGKLSLDDLNALAEKGNVSSGLLTLIFGSANPQEVALAFLHGEGHDADIEKKSAQTDLRNLL